MPGEAEFEIWQGGIPVASASGPEDAAWNEAMHYYAVYSQDGPCEIYRVKRAKVEIVGGFK